MGSSSNRRFKLAQIKFLDVSPNHPDRMIGRHQRLQIDCPKLDLIAYRFPHPWLSRIGHPLIFLYRKIGKKFVARHRCTSRTVQQQESLPACKLNPNRAQRFTASQDEGWAAVPSAHPTNPRRIPLPPSSRPACASAAAATARRLRAWPSTGGSTQLDNRGSGR